LIRLRKNKIILPLIISLFFTSCEKALDWTETYYRDSTEPYGAKSIYELLPAYMNNKEIEVIPNSIKPFLPEELRDTIKNFSFLDLEQFDTLSIEKSNFLFVKRDFQLSPGDANTLQIMINKGCHVIIASNEFGTTFSDNYEIELDLTPGFNSFEPDTALRNMKFQSIFFESEKGPIEFQVREKMVKNFFLFYPDYFEPFLTDSNSNALAIRAKIGEGSLTLCSSPKIFSNFQLIHSNYHLLNHFFSKLPEQKTYWGNNYVSRDPKTKFKKSDKSIMGFIFDNPSITWAFWILIAIGFLYTISNMRRLQKPFEQIDQLKNMSLSYISSVSQIYMKSRSHSEILKKKSDLFFWNLSRKYGLGKNESQEKVVTFLSKRITTISREEITESLEIAHTAQEEIDLPTKEMVLAFKKIDRLKNNL